MTLKDLYAVINLIKIKRLVNWLFKKELKGFKNTDKREVRENGWRQFNISAEKR